MIEIIKRWILFKIKSFQFQVRTLQNAYEISRAYSSVRSTRKFHYRKLMTTVVILIAGIGLFGAIAYGVVMIVRSDVIKNIQTAIVVKSRQSGLINNGHSNGKNFNIKETLAIEPAKADTLKPQQPAISAMDTDTISTNDTIVSPPVIAIPAVDSSLFLYDSGARPVTDDTSDYMIIVANKALHTMFVLQKDHKKKLEDYSNLFYSYRSSARTEDNRR